MRPFWKCLIASKILVWTKLMILLLWELEPTFYIGASWPKIEEVHISLVLLTFLCSSVRPFWKHHIVTKILIKKTWNLTLLVKLGAEFHIWTHQVKTENGPKWEKIEILWPSWSVKYIDSFLLHKRNRLWQDPLCFLNIARQDKDLSVLNYKTNLWVCIEMQIHHTITS